MPVYVSMLRGINVGPHKRMKMEKLRVSFEALGFESVKTFIQSGNVIFKAKKISTSTLSKTIEKQIADDFGFPVSVITRSAGEMSAAIVSNPFLKRPEIDPDKLHVMFLSGAPSAEASTKLIEMTAAPDQCVCRGNEIYFYFPNGVSGSVLMKKPVDRILGVVTTTRNWRTVNSVEKMCRDCQ